MDQQINDPPPPEEEEEEEVLLLVAAAISSSSADHDDLHKKYGIDVTYLTQEDVIKFKPSFWNVTQCQTDRLYSFYYQQEDMLVRRASHLRRVILGKENLVAPRLVLAERRQHQHQQYTSFGSSPATKEAYTTKPLVVDQYHPPPCKNSSTSMTSAVQEHGEDNACTATATNTDIVISKNVLTDVIEASEILLDDIKSIMDFLSESKKNYMDVLTVFDAYHGTNVKDTELASLEESHTFFNGSRLKVLMDLIIEDVVDKAEKKLIMMNEDASMAITTTTSTSAADTTSGRNDASSYINDKDHAHFKKGVVSQKDDENSRSSSLSVCKHIGASKSRGAKGRGLNVFSWWSSLMTRREKTAETEHQHQQDEKRSTIKERNKKSPTARSERQDSRSAAAQESSRKTDIHIFRRIDMVVRGESIQHSSAIAEVRSNI